MVVDRDDDVASRGVTWLLVILATMSAGLALAEPGEAALLALARAGGLCVLALGVHALQVRAPRGGRVAQVWVLGVFALLALPFLGEGVRLILQGYTHTLEVVSIAGLRNLGLGLATLMRAAAFRRLSALVSVFLILVGSSVAEDRAVLGILGAYAIAGCLWLMLAYWRGMGLPAPTRRRRMPILAPLLVLGIVGGAVALAALGPLRAAEALAELLPSSGGSTGENPEARSGVNDGDNEVSGSERPESVGFTDSDVYLDTDRPSLYDAFNDMYGEPLKPKQRDKMIALSNPNVLEQRERPAENLRAGRQFAAVRRSPRAASRRPSEREARALVYVKGRTPAHLGLVAHDRFDGAQWTEEPEFTRTFPLVLEDAFRPWFRLAQPLPEIFGATVSHQIKIGTLDSSPLPAPAHLARFRIGQVNRTDFLAWSHEGMIRMTDRTVPAGTVIDTESRSVDPRKLRRQVFPESGSRTDYVLRFANGYRIDPTVAELARNWIGAHPRGWGQVEAIVSALRGHARHDTLAVAPEDCQDVVAHFLLTSRRGPDYLFATSAAVMLRSLGYRTRLVSGLHARPDRYDPRTRHTPVRRDDVHVWAEVFTPGGCWVAIEPTPGYEIAGPAMSWTEALLEIVLDAARWGWARAPLLGLMVLALAALVWFRHEVADGIATWAWWLRGRRDLRHCVLRTLRLVERRARSAGGPRPPSLTHRRWYGSMVASTPALDARRDLEELLRLGEWTLYAPVGPGRAGHPTLVAGDPFETCARVVRGWTIQRFRAAAAAQNPGKGA